MRCLNEWKAGDGNTYQLAQIDDFSQIPSDIINATSMTFYDKGQVGSCPAYVTDLGDLIFDLQTSIDADVTLKFLDTETISGVMGRYDYITGGRRMTGDQWIDLANNNVFKQGGWGNWGDGKIKYYIAVVVDDENERAYVFSIENTYSHWAGNTGWNVKVLGGKPNDVDLFFEIFGEPLSKSGGAGSGYIGNSLVSNKKMVGYNVPTSSAEATKTESVNVYSATKEANKPKAGNGFARVKFLRALGKRCLSSITINGTVYPLAQISDFSFLQSSEVDRWVYRGSSTQQYIDSNGTEFIPILKPYPSEGQSDYKAMSNYNAVLSTLAYYTSGISGLRIGVRVNEGNSASGTILSSAGWAYDSEYAKLYIAIVIDDVTETGYILYSYYVKNEPYDAYPQDGYVLYANGGDNSIGRTIYSIFSNPTN